MTNLSAGYSGTPLAKKLSLKDGMRVWFDGMPQSVSDEINSHGLSLTRLANPEPGMNAAHIFVTERQLLEKHISILRTTIASDGQVWISWPKKASKVETDITEDTIRTVALPTGFVDIKVCAVDAIWSGLKLVIRKELR